MSESKDTTANLSKRLFQHLSGHGGKYTSDKKVSGVAYREGFGSLAEALRREKQIKGWNRTKKEALIAGDSVIPASRYIVSRLAQPLIPSIQ